jgi:macrolide-specific efflux system membrane fusion protein
MNKKIILTIISVILIALILTFALKKKSNVYHPNVGDLKESVYAISTVKSETNYTLRLGVVSSVEEYFVKEGDEVWPGQKLLRLEGGTIFKAPSAGVITERPFSIKETIAAQTAIIKIVDLKNLYIEANVEQLAALKINKGKKVLISFEDFRHQVFSGTVRSVLPREDDFIIQVNPEKLPKNILPGMSADLSIEIEEKKNVLTIPSKTISNGHILVKRNDSKEKEKLKVEIGIYDEINSEVLNPKLDLLDEIYIPGDEK